MKQLDAPLLARIYAPTPQAKCATYLQFLVAAMVRFRIDTLNRQAAFLGQLGVESQRLTKVEENLNYKTPSRLDEVYSAVHGTVDAAELIRRGPVAIANRVYAGKNGNGDEASGDGWRYRGAGGIQLTGKSNQAEFAESIGMPLEKVPAYLLTPNGAMVSAGWYWSTRNCNAFADTWDIDDITRKVNGKAMTAAQERRALSDLARKLLS